MAGGDWQVVLEARVRSPNAKKDGFLIFGVSMQALASPGLQVTPVFGSRAEQHGQGKVEFSRGSVHLQGLVQQRKNGR